MPLYDYICLDCGKHFELYLSYGEYGQRRVACAHCQSEHVRRRIPRIRVAKSEDSRMESLAGDFTDPSSLAGLEEDPKTMGRMMRKMGKELGENLPPEFDEVVGRLEKGENPDEIEKSLPDPGGGGEEEE